MSAPSSLHLVHPGLEARARTFLDAGLLEAGDLLVVDTLAPRLGERRAEVLVALAFAVRAPRSGHVGVVIRELRQSLDDEVARGAREPESSAGGVVSEPSVAWPVDAARWEADTLESPLVGAAEDAERPFARQPRTDGSVLVMTRRMAREQERLAAALLALVDSTPDPAFSAVEIERAVTLALGDPTQPVARAVRAALLGSLTLVTGGPGTGKTYSVKQLLARALELASQAGRALRVELAAPTGKAAVRMRQALHEDLDSLGASPVVTQALTELEPRTLHKLLGVRPDGTARHGADRRLPADLVIVDEASMIDLVLMRQLLEALRPGARLVLLGDRDQLASVEVGSVLADLVSVAGERRGDAREPEREGEAGTTGEAGAGLEGRVVRFSKAHRFAAGSSIARLALLLQERTERADDEAVALLSEGALALRHLESSRPAGAAAAGRPTSEQLDALAAPYVSGEGYAEELASHLRAEGARGASLRSAEVQRSLLLAFERYRVLAVHRRGARGAAGLDAALAERVSSHLERSLRSRGAPERLPRRGGYFLGQPLLVTENSYELGLMNGDLGLVLPGARGLAGVFPRWDDEALPLREVALSRLPPHLGAFALTVHKSQGSQFEHVALVLAGRESPIQTRELVYTAITRARRELTWLGDRDELRRALARPIQRASGLAELVGGRGAAARGAGMPEEDPCC